MVLASSSWWLLRTRSWYSGMYAWVVSSITRGGSGGTAVIMVRVAPCCWARSAAMASACRLDGLPSMAASMFLNMVCVGEWRYLGVAGLEVGLGVVVRVCVFLVAGYLR